jgi:hypothetical protein
VRCHSSINQSRLTASLSDRAEEEERLNGKLPLAGPASKGNAGMYLKAR